MFLRIFPIVLALATLSCNRNSSTKPGAAQRDANASSIVARVDDVHLHSHADQENFRRWFTAIAEMQFYTISDAWNEDQRDCAGCIRFAWREALRRHDHAWFQRMGEGYESWAPDVRAYNLESAPLREKIFRTASFAGDATTFSEYADAQTLLKYNCTFISRDRNLARPGDLLFFHQPWTQKFPYHVMLFMGTALHEGEDANDWVVYHTGASPEGGGTVKKVRLAVLDQHPDKRWRPVARNQNFLGFYRLNILN